MVLGILVVSGVRNLILTLNARLVIGLSFILSGSTLSGLVPSCMPRERSSSTTPPR